MSRKQRKEKAPKANRAKKVTRADKVRIVNPEKAYHSPKPLQLKSNGQRQYAGAILNDSLVLGIGYAGTGKTYVATRIIADLYSKGMFDKLILSRPTVDCGEKMGHLPGELDEKFAPYIETFEEALVDQLGIGKYKCDLYKNIIPKPIQYMRGLSFNDCGVIIDEAQNLTRKQAKMLISRIGYNCKLILCGDTRQSDIGNDNSGLSWLVNELRRQRKPYEIVEFQKEDCVRSPICADMLDLIDNSNDGW